MPVPDRQTRFRELLERSHARWVGIARAYARPEDREDLVQEIALQVWKGLPGFRGESNVDTWAYRVALNTALAWRRGSDNRATKLPQDAGDAVTQVAGAVDSENLAATVLDQFLASLPEATRAVMLLHLDGVPPAEAAEVLGISEGAHRTRLHRLRRKFEDNFCRGGSDDEV